ncbi:beta-1,3-glucan-binding protein-like [Frankliniella occidentalis]|uniref:Beta-1,3-glucan-binding protein-like n=1 Tax=Frankliniella occidentalis TaxID=133901 RepID=A0A9C6WXF8_FRAOC|nr:beta-1,3-glucan-binding protein-like [Frankliniella occidentalis]
MKLHRTAALVVLLAVLVAAAGEKLVFSDEFSTLDHHKWGHMVSAWRGGNNEFQYYRNSRNNSYVRDGILYLKPTLTADEFGEDLVKNGMLSYPDCNKEPCISQASADEIVLPVQSARISTWGKFSFRYGRLEVRARLPR